MTQVRNDAGSETLIPDLIPDKLEGSHSANVELAIEKYNRNLTQKDVDNGEVCAKLVDDLELEFIETYESEKREENHVDYVRSGIVSMESINQGKVITNFADILEPDSHYVYLTERNSKDLRGVDRSKLVLQGADFRDSNLAGANLEGVNLQQANLEGADLRWANLQGAILRWARLEIGIGTRLKGADLRGAFVKSNVLLALSTLYGANLRGVNLEADIGTATLQGTDLRGMRLIGAIPGNAALNDADLRGAHLSIDILGSCVLQGADLRGAYITGTNIGCSNLQGANLRGAHINLEFASTLENVDLTGVHYI